MLKYYLYYIEHPELINSKDKINFLYKGQPINFGDKNIARKIFKNEKYPKIIVTDPNNYLLNNSLKEDNNKKVNIIFNLKHASFIHFPSLNNKILYYKTDEWRYFQIKYAGKKLDCQVSDKKILLAVNNETTIDELLKKFLCKIHNPELIDSNKIGFISNGRYLKFGDQNPLKCSLCDMSYVHVYIDNSIKNGLTGTRIRGIDDFFVGCYDFKDYDYD